MQDNEGQSEGKRARVRRLLIDPLDGIGFRRGRAVAADGHRDAMARLADNLGYLSDQALIALREMLQTKGEGAAHNVWPAPATVYALAEMLERRPVEELPGCLRWFRSVEGPKALEAGTLVETWAYFRRMKRPPINASRELMERAADNRRRLCLIDERARAGVANDDDIGWARAYRDRLAWCEAMIRHTDDGQHEGAVA